MLLTNFVCDGTSRDDVVDTPVVGRSVVISATRFLVDAVRTTSVAEFVA